MAETEEKIKKFFSYFFRDPEEIKILISEEEEYLRIFLYHPAGEILIGKDGSTLKALEILVSRIVNHSLPEKKRVYLDVNNFKRKKEEELKGIIRKIAQKCRHKREEYTLPVMNSYQRRLVHLEISKFPDLRTESIGKEPERRVVIKPT